MNSEQRQEKIDRLVDLQQKITALTAKLGKVIKSIEGESYTADVVTSNIYQMLGVNGYSNSYNGDVQQVIDSLSNLNDDSDDDESDDNNESYSVVATHYAPKAEYPMALPQFIYEICTNESHNIPAIKAIRAETRWMLHEAINAVRIARSHLAQE